MIRSIITTILYYSKKIAEKFLETLRYILKDQQQTLLLNTWMNLYGGIVHNRNWGDDINFYFINEITDKTIFNKNCIFKPFVRKTTLNYLIIGSIIESHCNNASIIWGSGAMMGKHKLLQKPKKVCAVRGPLTRKFLLSKNIDCPEIYGDPALLISLYYKPNRKKRYKIGVIPNYIELDNEHLLNFIKTHTESVTLINMTSFNEWKNIIDKINECDFIISSSLHGLIIADSYNIPNLWVSFSNSVAGGYFKYRDYFLSVKRETEYPVVINSSIELETILQHKDSWKPISFNPIPLIKSCPFEIFVPPPNRTSSGDSSERRS